MNASEELCTCSINDAVKAKTRSVNEEFAAKQLDKNVKCSNLQQYQSRLAGVLTCSRVFVSSHKLFQF